MTIWAVTLPALLLPMTMKSVCGQDRRRLPLMTPVCVSKPSPVGSGGDIENSKISPPVDWAYVHDRKTDGVDGIVIQIGVSVVAAHLRLHFNSERSIDTARDVVPVTV